MVRSGVLRIVGIVLAAGVAALALADAATATVPAGPRLTFLTAEFLIKEGKPPAPPRVKESARLVSTNAEGEDLRPLLNSSSVQGLGPVVSWSAEAGEFAFCGKAAGPSAKQRIYIAGADGAGVHAIPGTTQASHPVLSPDGSLLAYSRTREHHPKLNLKKLRKLKNPKAILKHLNSFLRALEHSYSSTTTWIVPTAGGRPRRLTRWSDDLHTIPSSISPDGSSLAVSVERGGAKPAVDAVALASGRSRTLETNSADAVYSPDGSQIAFITYRDHESVPGFDKPEAVSELYVAAADGTGAVRITHTPHMQEGAPSWDPGGTRLAYPRSPGGGFGVLEQGIVESNADGTCPQVLTTPPPRHKGWETLIGAPTWVPGEGRQAAPLSC